MSTENKLNIGEHTELGAELKKTSARLRQLCGLVVGVYGPESLPALNFVRTMDAIERLRAEMEVQAAQDLQRYIEKNLYL
jgi:hypothetical protein